jgi:hypothetical protein
MSLPRHLRLSKLPALIRFASRLWILRSEESGVSLVSIHRILDGFGLSNPCLINGSCIKGNKRSIMIEDFFKKAKDLFIGSENDEDREVRPASEDPYGDPADQDYGNAIPASEDPYGDPADQQYYGNAIPASQDPYGDPADQQSYGNAIPASEDPYGDPADEEYRR